MWCGAGLEEEPSYCLLQSGERKNVMKIEPRMRNVLFLASHFDMNASYIKLC